MKKIFLFIFLCTSISFTGWAQKPFVRFTSEIPTTTEIGTILRVNFTYSATTDIHIFCGINLQEDWTWVSFLGGEGKKHVAGNDVEGSFDILIPKGIKPTAELKGKLNYKINIEMKSLPDYKWIAGDYPATPLNMVISK